MPFKDLPQQQQYGRGFAVLEQLFQKLSITSLPSSPSPLMKSLLPAPAPAAAPYIILIQHSLAKSIRLTKAGVMGESSSSNNNMPLLGGTRKMNESAANTMANTTNNATDLLYRRAGLSTPAETASRDWVAGTLWLEQMIREYQQQQPITTTTTPKTTSRLIWIQTTPSSLQPLPLMMNGDFLVSDDHNNVTIINASLDPWGWDSDDTDTANTPSVEYAATSPPHSHHRRPLANLDSLQSILAAVQFEIDNNNNSNSHSLGESIMVAFDSLTPLWTRHGFARVLRFLQNLSHLSSNNNQHNFRMILLLPVVTESLTQKQHLQLEDDLAHAVLWLQHGRHGVFLRRGVRESDNLMRHELPFDIISMTAMQQQQQGGRGGGRATNRNTSSRLVLVPGLTMKNQDEEVVRDDQSGIAGQQQRAVHAASRIAEPGGGGGKPHQHHQTLLVQQQQQQGRGGRAHVQLQLEQEEDAPRAQQPAAVTATTVQTQQPLIYLENDDPEFDDYDEEDPDDDLDI